MAKNDEARAGTILWFRRDLRLEDAPALSAAFAAGGPIWPVFILDDVVRADSGAAALWRLDQALEALGRAIAARGGRLILREGDPLAALSALAAETGAAAAHWTRLYTPGAIARDTRVKTGLAEIGVAARSFPGAALAEPWEIKTQSGGPFRVFTPFWRALRGAIDEEASAVASAPAPARWPSAPIQPASRARAELRLSRGVDRGAAILSRFSQSGEAAAAARLRDFIETRLERYADARDALDHQGGSGLSPALAFGEISPRRIWRETRAAMRARPELAEGGWSFLSEIAWRDFAWHLGYHTPELFERNWRSAWDAFPWRGDNDDAALWRRGRTGEPVVDAAMRELYVTGLMRNRARMIVASYLTKHLMTDWRVGAAWFRECLIDHDPASNAMGWQWTAGSGPDAAPFFRIFNPRAQAQKFDPSGAYVRRWLPEAAERGLGLDDAAADGRLFFEACPRSWRLAPADPYPSPLIDLSEGRKKALAAYDSLRKTA